MKFMENTGLTVLNGRLPGDRNGEYTFLGAMGSSVIDLCSILENIASFVSDFEVLAETFLDHLPISVSLYSNDEGPTDFAPSPDIEMDKGKGYIVPSKIIREYKRNEGGFACKHAGGSRLTDQLY